jgi:hypothetical protein
MTDADKPTLIDWNLRDFPEELRATCQKIALDERSKLGKRPRDAVVVARLLREALGLPPPPETQVLNSTHESIETEVRSDSPENAQGRSRETLRRKAKPAA